MGRTVFRLTDRIVNNLTAPGYHADGGGLYLQVTKSGTRSWVYRFTLNGRVRDMGLGSAQFIRLAQARAKVAECRALVVRGVDPIEHAKAERENIFEPGHEDTPGVKPTGPTFREFAEKYIDERLETWRNEKHRRQWRTSLARYAYPIIGETPLAAVDTPDVLRVLEPIWRNKSETASRVRGRIERILAAASVRGHRPAANPATWVGHLREALPPKRKAIPFAALAYAEVPAFMKQLAGRDCIGARALEFVILTAARSGEARGARWTEIDLTTGLWTVPAERMKARRPHIVPLSASALAVLDRLKPLRDLAGGFLFPGIKNGRPLSDMTLTALLRDIGLSVTVHGFRASFKTWAEQETGHANVVIEAALAHIVGDKAERAYMRGDWLMKRRALADDWGAYCIPMLPIEVPAFAFFRRFELEPGPG
jgi:integrase